MSINVLELEQLLRQLTLPDTNAIKTATDVLNKNYFKKAECVPAMVEVLVKSQLPEVRQLSAVLLRKRIVKLWTSVPQQNQEGIKQLLLGSIANEQLAIVRHSTARLVAVIAKYEVPAGKWNGLLEYLYGCCQSNQAAHREIGMYLFSVLIEPIGEELRPHFNQLFTLFANGMKDPESLNVQVTAIEAAGALAPLLSSEQEIQIFRDLIPLMTQVINNCLVKGDEESAIKIFEVFDELIECEVPVLARAVPVLVRTFLQIGTNKNLEQNTRSQAINFVSWIARYKKKAILKNKLLEEIVNTVVPLIGETEENEDDDEEGQNVSSISAQTIDVLSLNMPPEQIVPIVSQNVQKYFQSPNPKERKAAMVSLAVMIEGCSDYLRYRLKDVVGIVVAGLADPDLSVKEAACLAVEQLSVNVQPEASEHHAMILPALFQIMDASERIQERSCMALEAFCEQMGTDIMPYLQPLMEKLLFTLQRANVHIQETIICAIGSIAYAAQKEFLPFFPQVAQLLKTAMSIQTETHMNLRGVATDTMGTLANVVGAEAFMPHYDECMAIVSDGLKINDSVVKECTWSFFSSLSKALKQDFVRFVPHIVPLLFESCLSNEGINPLKDDGEIEFEDDEEDDDEDGGKGIAVATSFLHEKEIACRVLGDIFENTQQAYLPYLEKSIDILRELVDYFHPDIRRAAVETFGKFLTTLHTLFDGYETWDPSKQTAIHQNVSTLAEYVIPSFIQIMSDDEEREVVAEACSVTANLLPKIGPQIADGKFEALGVCVMQLLTKSSKCQTIGADYEDEENEDDEGQDDELEAELDAMLIDSVSELISSMAKVLGKSFLPYFQQFLPHILKYYKKNRPVADRSMSIGCLAEVSAAMKESIIPFADELMNNFLKGLSDEDDEVQNNAAFGCGVLCESVGADSSKFYLYILQKLRPLMTAENPPGLLDNCCACLARMIITNSASMPLDQVLPVLLGFLPLRTDFVENEVVLNCIFYLFNSNNPHILNNLPLVLVVFAKYLASADIKPEQRVALVNYIKNMPQLGDRFTTAISQIAPEFQQILSAAASS